MHEYPSNENGFWLLGRDQNDQWQQGLAIVDTPEQAEAAWLARHGRFVEISISRATLENGMGGWLDLDDGMVLARAGRLFGAWVEQQGRWLLVPIQAPDEVRALAQIRKLNPGIGEVIIVPGLPLMEALDTLRSGGPETVRATG